MCGRYGLYSRMERVAGMLGLVEGLPVASMIAQYNITPRLASSVALRRQGLDFRLSFESYKWGLLPFWAKSQDAVKRQHNARAETVFKLPTFREPIRRRRCLVPADGYYEWQTVAGEKLPWWFTMASGEPFFFGGIWDHWHAGKPDLVPTFALLTTEPNELCRTVHDRMPVIVHAKDYEQWLDPEVTDEAAIAPLALRPFPAELMRSWRVSKAVNNSRANGPQLIEPI